MTKEGHKFGRIGGYYVCLKCGEKERVLMANKATEFCPVTEVEFQVKRYMSDDIEDSANSADVRSCQAAISPANTTQQGKQNDNNSNTTSK